MVELDRMAKLPPGLLAVLRECGLLTAEMLESVTDSELLAIKGLSINGLSRIRECVPFNPSATPWSNDGPLSQCIQLNEVRSGKPCWVNPRYIRGLHHWQNYDGNNELVDGTDMDLVGWPAWACFVRETPDEINALIAALRDTR